MATRVWSSSAGRPCSCKRTPSRTAAISAAGEGGELRITRWRADVPKSSPAEFLTAPRCPWQSPYVERLIGSIRRECLDHIIVINQDSLRKGSQSCRRFNDRRIATLAVAELQADEIRTTIDDGSTNEHRRARGNSGRRQPTIGPRRRGRLSAHPLHPCAVSTWIFSPTETSAL